MTSDPTTPNASDEWTDSQLFEFIETGLRQGHSMTRANLAWEIHKDRISAGSNNPDRETLAKAITRATEDGRHAWAVAVSKMPETYTTEPQGPYVTEAIISAVLALLNTKGEQ